MATKKRKVVAEEVVAETIGPSKKLEKNDSKTINIEFCKSWYFILLLFLRFTFEVHV